MAKLGKFSTAGVSIDTVKTKTQQETEITSEYGAHTGRKTVAYKDIEVNELNANFTQEDIEELCASIREHGLFHELAVVYDGPDKKYKLISGERRYRAIGLLTEEERAKIFPKGIPVNVLSTVSDGTEEEIAIIEANLLSRDYTPAERAKHIFRLISLYEEKKKSGEISSTRKVLMEKFNIKGHTAQIYMTANKLVPELKEAIEKGVLPIRETENLSKLSEDTQKQLAKLLNSKENGEKFSAQDLEAAKAYEKENTQLKEKIAENEKALKESENKLSKLQKLLEAAETVNQEDEQEQADSTIPNLVESYKEALAKSEKEKKAAITNLEKVRLEMKNRQEKGINASEDDLRKARNLVRLETTLDQLYNVQKTLATLRDDLKQDEELLERFFRETDNINTLYEELKSNQ